MNIIYILDLDCIKYERILVVINVLKEFEYFGKNSIFFCRFICVVVNYINIVFID